MFPSFVGRPRTLGILVGMDQKDFFIWSRSSFPRAVLFWVTMLFALCFLQFSSGPDARHLSRVQMFVSGYIFTCTLQPAVTCSVSGVPDEFGIWTLGVDFVETLCILRPWFDSG